MQVDDISTVSQITDDIKKMLMSHPKVFLGKEAPYCFLSQIESTYAELTVGCNLKKMVSLIVFVAILPVTAYAHVVKPRHVVLKILHTSELFLCRVKMNRSLQSKIFSFSQYKSLRREVQP